MRQLAIRVRARTSKETLTLGFMVARHYFFSLLAALLPLWAASVLSGVLLWWLVGGANGAILAVMVVWWLKPLYERPAFMRLSRLLFHEPGDWRSEQKSAFARGWLGELTLLRLARAGMPIRYGLRLLEGVSGREYRKRKRFFSAAEGGVSALLLLALLELSVFSTLMLLLPYLAEEHGNAHLLVEELENYAYMQIDWLFTLFALMYFLLAAVTGVFYVGMGFMRYLNRRIISEGWALALDLQALAARLPLCLAVCGLTLFFLYVPPAAAIDARQSAADKAWVEARVNDPRRGPYEVRRVEVNGSRRGTGRMPDYLPGQQSGTGQLVRLLLVGGGVVFLLFLLMQVAKYRDIIWRGSVRRHAEEDAGTTCHRDGMAAENSAAALRYLQAGEVVAALAVLYGRMVAEPARHHLPAFARGESESEYLARSAAQIGTRQGDFLREFFALWQRTVYAHQVPDKQAVHMLIRRYQQLWQE